MIKFTTKRSQESRLYVANIIEEGKIGGPQVRIIQVAKFLEKNVKTVVIMPQDSNEFQQCCQSLGVPFQALPLSRITKELRPALHYILYSPVEVLKLIFLFRREQFDLIYVSGGSWQFKGAIAGKLAGIPVLWHLNDSYMPLFIRIIFRMLSGLASGYVYASVKTKNYYKDYIKSDRYETIIPAPVDTSKFNLDLDYPDDELLSELEGKFVIGTVANINPIKDLDTFISASKIIQSNYENVLFLVLGNTSISQSKYQNALKRKVYQLGIVNYYWAGSRKDVRPLLKRFDVYVCSSKSESSPISVWEAMSMARPIVSTHVGDVPLYVQNDYNGYIVAIEDSNQMADCVLKLLKDETLRKRFGSRSREIAKESLDIELCAKKHLYAYNQF